MTIDITDLNFFLNASYLVLNSLLSSPCDIQEVRQVLSPQDRDTHDDDERKDKEACQVSPLNTTHTSPSIHHQ